MIAVTIQDDLRTGRLEHVLPGYGIDRGGLYAVYPSRHHLSPKVRVFVDYLCEKLGGLGQR
jgi:DNA-binding transcriptional LysR family regulator